MQLFIFIVAWWLAFMWWHISLHVYMGWVPDRTAWSWANALTFDLDWWQEALDYTGLKEGHALVHRAITTTTTIIEMLARKKPCLAFISRNILWAASTFLHSTFDHVKKSHILGASWLGVSKDISDINERSPNPCGPHQCHDWSQLRNPASGSHWPPELAWACFIHCKIGLHAAPAPVTDFSPVHMLHMLRKAYLVSESSNMSKVEPSELSCPGHILKGRKGDMTGIKKKKKKIRS